MESFPAYRRFREVFLSETEKKNLQNSLRSPLTSLRWRVLEVLSLPAVQMTERYDQLIDTEEAYEMLDFEKSFRFKNIGEKRIKVLQKIAIIRQILLIFDRIESEMPESLIFHLCSALFELNTVSEAIERQCEWIFRASMKRCLKYSSSLKDDEQIYTDISSSYEAYKDLLEYLGNISFEDFLSLQYPASNTPRDLAEEWRTQERVISDIFKGFSGSNTTMSSESLKQAPFLLARMRTRAMTIQSSLRERRVQSDFS